MPLSSPRQICHCFRDLSSNYVTAHNTLAGPTRFFFFSTRARMTTIEQVLRQSFVYSDSRIPNRNEDPKVGRPISRYHCGSSAVISRMSRPSRCRLPTPDYAMYLRFFFFFYFYKYFIFFPFLKGSAVHDRRAAAAIDPYSAASTHPGRTSPPAAKRLPIVPAPLRPVPRPLPQPNHRPAPRVLRTLMKMSIFN